MQHSDELSQNKYNNTLAFALRSMMFDPYVRIALRRRLPDRSLEILGGGSVSSVLSRYGSLEIERASITTEGILFIIVR